MKKRDVIPLSYFPQDRRNEIERLANLPDPPPKHFDFLGMKIPSRAYYEWKLRHPKDKKKGGK